VNATVNVDAVSQGGVLENEDANKGEEREDQVEAKWQEDGGHNENARSL